MPTITIPDIPEDLMEKIQINASVNGRSVEDEALIWLQDAGSGRVMPRERTPKEEAEIEREFRRYQANMPKVNINDDELNRYKREGRL